AGVVLMLSQYCCPGMWLAGVIAPPPGLTPMRRTRQRRRERPEVAEGRVFRVLHDGGHRGADGARGARRELPGEQRGGLRGGEAGDDQRPAPLDHGLPEGPDLLWFDVTVKGPLETAAGLLRGSGGGLADDIQAAVSQAHALTEHATGVLLGYAATAQQLSSRVMPGLRVAMSDLKTTRTSVANLLGMVQGCLTADPRAAARESRRRYVRLLEQAAVLAPPLWATMASATTAR
ncbi:unnamed protein product, partial [Prorocentrum cordatum]